MLMALMSPDITNASQFISSTPLMNEDIQDGFQKSKIWEHTFNEGLLCITFPRILELTKSNIQNLLFGSSVDGHVM